MGNDELDLDRALVAAVLRGDADARDKFVQRMDCIPRLVVVRLRRSRRIANPDLVDDLSQEAFGVIWQQLERYRGECPLEGWVHGYVMRIVSAGSRRAFRDRALGDADGIQPDRIPAECDVEDEDEEVVQVLELLEKLPPGDEEVVRLRFFGGESHVGLNHDQVAERLGCSQRAARARFQRAMERLRALADHHHESLP